MTKTRKGNMEPANLHHNQNLMTTLITIQGPVGSVLRASKFSSEVMWLDRTWEQTEQRRWACESPLWH
jgi:hypothetical protein